MDELRMLSRLNAETRVHHGDADTDIDRYLFGRVVTSSSYQSYLARMFGVVAPLEAAVACAPGLDSVLDVGKRAKAHFVVNDLLALGTPMTEIDALPQCDVPTFRGPAAALGWLYVVERPLLASAVIRGHLLTQLPTDIARASSYLLCYAGRVGAMWRALGEAMDRVADSPAAADRIVVAAHEAFRAVHRWRLNDADRAIRYAG